MKRGCLTIESVQGQRNHQEDRSFSVRLGESRNSHHLFGVFDGHGGMDAAEECRILVPRFAELYYGRTPVVMLRNIAKNLCRLTEKYVAQGCTMSMALVRPKYDDVWVAVIGDSPVVVVDKHGVVSIGPLHNVGTNEKERESAQSRGGVYLRQDGCGYIGKPGFYDYCLQMSRSLGDHALGDVILREPEIFQVKNPRRVVVATDGILEELLDYKNPATFANRLLPYTIAHELLKGLEPHDNLTIALWNHD